MKKPNRLPLILSVTGVILAPAWGCTHAQPTTQPASATTQSIASATQPARPSRWAQPVTAKGLSNCFMVTPNLYRGAQPEEEGFASLKEMGIKTVLCLRSLHSDRKACNKVGLDYVSIEMQAWDADEKDIIAALKILTDPARAPVFVHCQHGADRTGTVMALHRIGVEGWSKEDAIREMTEGGYGFHSVWRNLVRYVQKVDPEKLKQQLAR